jgi:hypothetical protein
MKYKKRPLEVQAGRYRPGMEDGFDCCTIENGEYFRTEKCNTNCQCHNYGKWCGYMTPYINTLEGKQYITMGDFIITGVKGERYPCKPDIFEMTYEVAE